MSYIQQLLYAAMLIWICYAAIKLTWARDKYQISKVVGASWLVHLTLLIPTTVLPIYTHITRRMPLLTKHLQEQTSIPCQLCGRGGQLFQGLQ